MSFLDKPVPGDYLMVIGGAMCAYGMWAHEFYMEIGGFALFFAGVMTLKPLEGKGEEGLQEDGGESENPLGPRS